MKKTNTLSVLVHAFSKVGKSTLTSTAPMPMIVLDAEGSWRFIKKQGFGGRPIRVRHWDPMLEAMPRQAGDEPWDVVIVTVREWVTIQRVYTRLTQEEHDFQTVVLDSISEIQRRCKQNIVGTAQMQMQQWGELLTLMDTVIRGYRDLNLMPGPVRCVVFVAESRMSNNRWRPYMQGQIDVSLPYWVDICGYLFVEEALDPSDPAQQRTMKVRKLLVGAHPSYETGERVQGALPDIIENPNISQMLCQIFGDDCAEEATA